MNRIIEAFTRAHCELTAVDEIIIFITLSAAVVIIGAAFYAMLSKQ